MFHDVYLEIFVTDGNRKYRFAHRTKASGISLRFRFLSGFPIRIINVSASQCSILLHRVLYIYVRIAVLPVSALRTFSRFRFVVLLLLQIVGVALCKLSQGFDNESSLVDEHPFNLTCFIIKKNKLIFITKTT